LPIIFVANAEESMACQALTAGKPQLHRRRSRRIGPRSEADLRWPVSGQADGGRPRLNAYCAIPQERRYDSV
jgi:hypothetical protein